jgi:uncharacterized integral membrane protein
MKKVKILFWVIIFGFLGLLIFQNQDFFLARNSFGLNLYFTQYQIPEASNAILFLAAFFAGLLIAYIFSLFGQYKNGKTIKNLNATIHSQVETISKLKSEMSARAPMPADPVKSPESQTSSDQSDQKEGVSLT